MDSLLYLVDYLHFLLLEVLLVGRYVFEGDDEVLLKIVIKSLPRNLNTNTQSQLHIDHCLF